MSKKLRVLMIEDSENDELLIKRTLEQAGYQVIFKRVTTELQMSQALEEEAWQLIIADHSLPQFDALEALAVLKKYNIDIPFIILSGTIREDLAITAMKSGAHDYLMKDNLSRLAPAVERELREAIIRQEEKKAQALLAQHTIDLARSNTELEQFAYVISHDLQEPLRTITSFLQLLQERYDGQLDEKGCHFIARSVAGAKHMQALILDLLKFAQVNREELLMQNTDCKQILDSTLLNLQALIQESKAVITHDKLPTLVTEPFQLSRLFQNLISNAIKFRGEDSPKIHIGAKQNDAEWEFSVADNGIGIELEYFERIFDIFEQLHPRRDCPGTGIGLAIAKRIVERFRGQIWVASKPGEGSTFYFTLPKKEAITL